MKVHGQSNVTRSLWLTMGVLAIFFIMFGLYSYSELRVQHARAIQLKSVLLGNELRQTSDDLSRMVRLYVSTINPLYKHHYQEILAIRNGKAPRPTLSDEIYWDLVLENNDRPRQNAPAISLLELMRQADFTESEFEKLSDAKLNSDKLTHIEIAAMKLVENQPKITDSTRLKAIEMLSDETYLQAKMGIMQPIAAFITMVKVRTQEAVRAEEYKSSIFLALAILFGFLLVYMLWGSYRALNATLGCSADKLRAVIEKMGRGEFSTRISVPQGINNSVLNWLSEMQAHLLHSESERKKMDEQIKQLAYYDALTNLPNRRMLSDRLTHALALSKRTSRYGALLFIDLDHFKPINDQYGHDAGDKLLMEVAKRLISGFREIDTVARFGGDEFVVMVSELAKDKATACAHATIIAEKIQAILGKRYSITLENNPKGRISITHHCSTSIGVVTFLGHQKSQEELLKLADMAMYKAKESGCNQISFS